MSTIAKVILQVSTAEKATWKELAIEYGTTTTALVRNYLNALASGKAKPVAPVPVKLAINRKAKGNSSANAP